jgi:Uma2 family endonuclease
VLLDDVDWRTYTRLLAAFAGRRSVRLTYDRGRLEIMAPLKAHGGDEEVLGQFVHILTEELDLPINANGAITIRKRDKERGLEPDRCFWIANAHRVAGVRRLDLRRHPPPDLAIEAEVTSSALDRMGIYAALQVPEVWRLGDDFLSFHVLQADGTYAVAERSRAFPQVSAADLLPFLREARVAGDQNPVLRRFREWVRRRARGNGRRG